MEIYYLMSTIESTICHLQYLVVYCRGQTLCQNSAQMCVSLCFKKFLKSNYVVLWIFSGSAPHFYTTVTTVNTNRTSNGVAVLPNKFANETSKLLSKWADVVYDQHTSKLTVLLTQPDISQLRTQQAVPAVWVEMGWRANGHLQPGESMGVHVLHAYSGVQMFETTGEPENLCRDVFITKHIISWTVWVKSSISEKWISQYFRIWCGPQTKSGLLNSCHPSTIWQCSTELLVMLGMFGFLSLQVLRAWGLVTVDSPWQSQRLWSSKLWGVFQVIFLLQCESSSTNIKPEGAAGLWRMKGCFSIVTVGLMYCSTIRSSVHVHRERYFWYCCKSETWTHQHISSHALWNAGSSSCEV